MNRVEQAKELVDVIHGCIDTIPPELIENGVLDRLNIVVFMDIMMSLAVIADSVNKEEKDD